MNHTLSIDGCAWASLYTLVVRRPSDSLKTAVSRRVCYLSPSPWWSGWKAAGCLNAVRSHLSVLLLGPLLASFILRYLKNYGEETSSFCFREEKPIVHAADLTVLFILLIEIAIIAYCFYKSYKKGLPMILRVIINAEGPAIFLVKLLIVFIKKLKKCIRGEPGINQDTKGDCWKMCDTLIILYLIDIYKWSRYLYIIKRACLRHVFCRLIYGTVPRAYNGTLSECFFRISRELWVGVNRSVVVKSWINRELIMKRCTAFSRFRHSGDPARTALQIMDKQFADLEGKLKTMNFRRQEINALFKLKKPISEFIIKNAGINRWSVQKNTIKNTIHHWYKLRLN